MDCETARSALSARLDGESLLVPWPTLERHLSACPSCRDWQEDAHAVTRRVRLAGIPVAPAVPNAMLRTLVVTRARFPRQRDGLVLRAALVLIALAQLVVTIPALVLGRGDGPAHVAHEMGSFELALAVGLLVAAWRPERAPGMRPIVGVAAVLLVLTAVIDLAAGRASPGSEAPDLLVLAGWLVLGRLAAVTRPDGEAPASLAGVARRIGDRSFARRRRGARGRTDDVPDLTQIATGAAGAQRPTGGEATGVRQRGETG